MNQSLGNDKTCWGYVAVFLCGILLVTGCRDRQTSQAEVAPAVAAKANTEHGRDTRSTVPAMRNSPPRSAVPAGELTFNKHIAGIIFAECISCHRPGESAPFSLLSYEDVKKRADQIVAVTQSRYMPPWPPEPGPHRFAGERRLSDDQIDSIQRWVQAGAAEGDPSHLPQLPKFTEGWQLGQPDLVVEMPEPFTVPAKGADVFRNFVIPIPVDGKRYVRAVELRPNNKRLVHHANMLIDRTSSCQRLDERDAEPGFAGMDAFGFGDSEIPQGHFLNWKPGSPTFGGIQGAAWLLRKGTDLIVNLHMLPTGKTERVTARAGFYFAEEPPTGHPLEMIQLEHDSLIDIPPGEKDFVITDQFELPVDVDVYGVYPHAHYVGKSFEGFAMLPGGSRLSLIHIKEWDFNWQAVYRYAEPISLPQGTTIGMRVTYDNSTDNVRNPSNPPKRVTTGKSTFDEMGHLWIQVRPRSTEDLTTLQFHKWRHKVEKYPYGSKFHYNLGIVLKQQGKWSEAAQQLRTALRFDKNLVQAHAALATFHEHEGRIDEAISEYELALKIRPDFIYGRIDFANLLISHNHIDEAIHHLDKVLKTNPEYVGAHVARGLAEGQRGNWSLAKEHFTRALQIEPDSARALFGLASAYQNLNNVDLAVEHYEKVLRFQPDNIQVHLRLGNLQRSPAQAVRYYEQALQYDPEHAGAHNYLGSILAIQGNVEKARAHFERALRREPDHVDANINMGNVWGHLGQWDRAVPFYERVTRMLPNHAGAHIKLGVAYGNLGKLTLAIKEFQRALDIQPSDGEARKYLDSAQRMLKNRKELP